MVKGLSNDHGARIAAAAMDAPFTSIEDVLHRTGVPVAALEKLADADAFRCFGLDRRQALWRIRGLGGPPLPLFAAAEARASEPEVALTPLTEGREVVEDYRAVQLSLRRHPAAFLRPELSRLGLTPSDELARMKDGARVAVAGVVLVRQRPGKGNVTFITLEDETGIANAIAWQRIFETNRRVILSAAMIAVHGTLQREGKVIHIVTERIEDLTHLLARVGEMSFPHRPMPPDGPRGGGRDPRERKAANPALLAGRDGGIRIRSRDFH
jgi:error-prone DNA polymerase